MVDVSTDDDMEVSINDIIEEPGSPEIPVALTRSLNL